MIRIKNEKQIDGIRRSCKLLARLYRELVPGVKAGMTTWDIDKLCVDFITAHGGTPAWYSQDFPGAACISVNDEVIHGIPSKKRVIQEGDLVSLDIGIDLDGYISDSAVTVPVGKISERERLLVDTTTRALEAESRHAGRETVSATYPVPYTMSRPRRVSVLSMNIADTGWG